MTKKNDYRSFLVINPFGIGDCLFSTPLLHLLRRNFPSAKIYFLCNKKSYPVMRDHPLVEKAFIYERDDFVNAWRTSFFTWLSKSSGFIADIRRERIDVCLDLSLNTQYGFYAWAAGIRRRFGLDYKRRCFFLNKKIRIDGFIDKHVADYYASVVKFLGLPAEQCAMSIGIQQSDTDWAQCWIKEHGMSAYPVVIGVAPCGGDTFGANAHVRRWPAEYYASLIKRLRASYNAAILIFAGPKESPEVHAIMRDAGDTAGIFDLSTITLGQTIALIAHCALFIGNDTGALRFADALQKKLVAFYGPADDIVYGPYPPDYDKKIILKKELVCRPCYKRFRMPACDNDRACLRGISVDEACDAVETLLKKKD